MRPNKNAQPIILDKLGIFIGAHVWLWSSLWLRFLFGIVSRKCFFNNVDNLFDQANWKLVGPTNQVDMHARNLNVVERNLNETIVFTIVGGRDVGNEA